MENIPSDLDDESDKDSLGSPTVPNLTEKFDQKFAFFPHEKSSPKETYTCTATSKTETEELNFSTNRIHCSPSTSTSIAQNSCRVPPKRCLFPLRNQNVSIENPEFNLPYLPNRKTRSSMDVSRIRKPPDSYLERDLSSSLDSFPEDRCKRLMRSNGSFSINRIRSSPSFIVPKSFASPSKSSNSIEIESHRISSSQEPISSPLESQSLHLNESMLRIPSFSSSSSISHFSVSSGPMKPYSTGIDSSPLCETNDSITLTQPVVDIMDTTDSDNETRKDDSKSTNIIAKNEIVRDQNNLNSVPHCDPSISGNRFRVPYQSPTQFDDFKENLFPNGNTGVSSSPFASHFTRFASILPNSPTISSPHRRRRLRESQRRSTSCIIPSGNSMRMISVRSVFSETSVNFGNNHENNSNFNESNRNVSVSSGACNYFGPILDPLSNPIPSSISCKNLDGVEFITPFSVAKILKCPDSRSFCIIDCRFNYEYQGGHIRQAMNVCYHRDLEREFLFGNRHRENLILIFHCEFSSHRGPNLYKHLRKLDREAHRKEYPRLFYPEMYCIEGGYKNFYEKYSELCEGGYVPMDDPKFKEERKRNFNLLRVLAPVMRRSSSDSIIRKNAVEKNLNTAAIANSSPYIPSSTTTITTTTTTSTTSTMPVFSGNGPSENGVSGDSDDSSGNSNSNDSISISSNSPSSSSRSSGDGSDECKEVNGANSTTI